MKKINIEMHLKQMIVITMLTIAGHAQLSWAAEQATTAEQQYQQALTVETMDRDLEKAIPLYQNVVDRPDVNPEWKSKAYYQMGLCYERLGKVPEAIVAYEGAAKNAGASPDKTTQLAESSMTRLKQQQEKENEVKVQHEKDRQTQAAEIEKNRFNIKKGSQMLSLDFGAALPITKVPAIQGVPIPDLSDNGTISIDGSGKEGTLGGPGPAIGLGYVYHLTPHWGIGGKFQYAKYNDNTISRTETRTTQSPTQTVEDSNTLGITFGGKSYLSLLMARYVFVPDGKFHPFVSGGAGIHHTVLSKQNTFTSSLFNSLGSPQRESFTSTTHPAKSSRTGFAGMLGLGGDYSVSEKIYLGLEGNWVYLRNIINPTFLPPYNAETISTSIFIVSAKVGYKFK